jgi:hypothetical protein
MMDEMLQKLIDGDIYIFMRNRERKEGKKLIFMALVRPSNNFFLIELRWDTTENKILDVYF